MAESMETPFRVMMGGSPVKGVGFPMAKNKLGVRKKKPLVSLTKGLVSPIPSLFLDLQVERVVARGEGFLFRKELLLAFVPADHGQLNSGGHILDGEAAIIFGHGMIRIVENPNIAPHPSVDRAADLQWLILGVQLPHCGRGELPIIPLGDGLVE